MSKLHGDNARQHSFASTNFAVNVKTGAVQNSRFRRVDSVCVAV